MKTLFFLVVMSLLLPGQIAGQRAPRHGWTAEEVVAKIKRGDLKLVFWSISAQPYAYVLRTDGHKIGLWFVGERTPLILSYKPGGEEAGQGLPLWTKQFFRGNWEERQPFLLVGIYQDIGREYKPVLLGTRIGIEGAIGREYEPVFYGYRRGGMVFPTACVTDPCISVDDTKPLLQQELNSLTAWTFYPDRGGRRNLPK